MKRYLNSAIFFAGLVIFISDLIVGHPRCTVVGLSLMFLSLINHKYRQIRLVIPRIFLFSIMFWIIRFSLISISTVLNFYYFVPVKFSIFTILFFFFIRKLFHHPFYLYKPQVLILFLVVNFFLDLIITYRFDHYLFIDPFFYITMLPVVLILYPNHLFQFNLFSRR